ncbi:MAG: hypothetical protein HY094_08775 [Candidatus Melainabacteria bacterium]|nr:hypothetical protein [Candidatus Melainabacteria bacterium]
MKPIYPVIAATLLGAITTGNKNLTLPQVRGQIANSSNREEISKLLLKEVMDESEKIFSGICAKIKRFKEDPDAKEYSVEFTFKIIKGLKGINNKDEIKIKHYDTASLNGYRRGHKYILFLPAPIKGFTPPLGLYGRSNRFEVYEKVGGDFVVHQKRDIEYEQFVKTIKEIQSKNCK